MYHPGKLSTTTAFVSPSCGIVSAAFQVISSVEADTTSFLTKTSSFGETYTVPQEPLALLSSVTPVPPPLTAAKLTRVWYLMTYLYGVVSPSGIVYVHVVVEFGGIIVL